MTHLYLYHNGPRGGVLFCRALYRSLLPYPDLTVSIGVCSSERELLGDLVGPRCDLVVSEFCNTPFGAPLDLVAYKPKDALAVEIEPNEPGCVPIWQWPHLLDRFQRSMAKAGLELDLSDRVEPVPMLDFQVEARPPLLRRPSLFLDTDRSADPSCWFVYDLERLARIFSQWDLLCTSPPHCQADNLVDISALDWLQRSRISEQCSVLVGTTPDPFALTLTEANRWKPKALCGYDARVTQPIWDYLGNPMELLGTMDELVDFLLANVAERQGS